ncbi:MAG: hypothetical protein U9Q22_07815 [Candidatus Altiarchaeota archaeon]|nr:hypothetical protein [Candidatus Altiarchaeota archaeon]
MKKILSGFRRERRNRYFIANILGVLSFLVIGFLIAPIIHELLHMLVFEFHGCYYTSHLAIDESMRLHGSLKPFCDLDVTQSVILLGVGVSGNFILACILFLLSYEAGKTGELPLSNFLVLTAWGFFLDPLFYLFADEGDIINILMLTERGDLIQYLPMLGSILFLLFMAYTYLHLRNSFEDYLDIMHEIKTTEVFVNQINSGSRLKVKAK